MREEIAAGATTFRALPEIVTLNSTDICNLRCVMCPRSIAQGEHRLEDRVVAFVCDELFPTALKVNLTTAGGEPLGPGFDAILERARRHDVKVDVVTNGMLLTRELIEDLAPALDHLNVSVDCAEPEVYERIRAGASFERLLDNLGHLRDRKDRADDEFLFSISAIVMASTLEHLPALVRFAAQHAVDGVVLQRLNHEIKPTRDEDVLAHYTLAEAEGLLDETARVARELGVDLYQAELGRPNVITRGSRPKVPATIDDSGVCYFLAQSFSVMYTGEVYPCCKPTNYMLGDVRYEHPVDIWNGERLQRLRRAHLERRGTLFCNSCEYAPHLQKGRGGRMGDAVRLGVRAVSHVAHSRGRRDRERSGWRVFDPPPPAHVREAPIAPEPAAEPADLVVQRMDGRREASAVEPDGETVWFLRRGELFRAPARGGVERSVHVFPESSDSEAAFLVRLHDGSLLVSFERSGSLLRVDVTRATPVVRSVLQLSDPRSWIRRPAFARTPSGDLWIGEYGVFPGARCARVYRSRDGGASFELVRTIRPARHVHAVASIPGSEDVLVSTGDVGVERRTLRIDARGGMRVVFEPWAGFTGICFSGDRLHLGTDLPSDNGVLRVDAELRGAPELRPLADSLDLQVRQIDELPDRSLLALLSMDQDLDARRSGRRAVLLHSSDSGESWRVVHAFASDWSDAPERFEILPGPEPRILTDGTNRAALLRAPSP